MASNVLNRRRVESVADELGTNPGLIEKDWHVVRAIGVIAGMDHDSTSPVFAGGTSLFKGWGLIKRFSEDVDFKVSMPSDATRVSRRTYRNRILAALADAQFTLLGEPLRGNASRFFSADLAYPMEFGAGPGLRPHIKIEMTFAPPALPPIVRPVSSLVALVGGEGPEIAGFPCVDPIETAADKLSALAWRVCADQHGEDREDPSVIRHLHDLAALESLVAEQPEFIRLLQQSMLADAHRGGEGVPANPAARVALMLDCLSNYKQWSVNYRSLVHQVSFGDPDDIVSFDDALEACRRLTAVLA
ncbi:nucleotidyl transferase AbiEii/AbiGii toxin family protein [Marinibaculum pumilum]|uniref:Nucleotidyl transferase AbiEii/AbiGii toxin family protein n=1 Tax=Marinibaculum pumilum TaxID=1766165 RepID=A0ABV7KV75_9PROT